MNNICLACSGDNLFRRCEQVYSAAQNTISLAADYAGVMRMLQARFLNFDDFP